MTTHIFAAARDGDMLLSSFHHKGTDEEAETKALYEAAQEFELTCPFDEIESELDGFSITRVEGLVD